MAEAQYSYELGRYAGLVVNLSMWVAPDFDAVEEFAAVVYCSHDDGTKTQIARIDTAHDRTHFDRLFLAEPDKKDMGCTWHEAEAQLTDNWRQYVRQYQQHHGL